MNPAKVLSIILIFVLLILAIIPMIPEVKAAGPTVTSVQNANNFCAYPVTTCTVTFGVNPTAGNAILVSGIVDNGPPFTLTSIASTADTYTTISVSGTRSPGGFGEFAFSGYILSTAGGANAKAITVTMGQNQQIEVEAFEVSVSAGFSFTTATTFTASNSQYSAPSSFNYSPYGATSPLVYSTTLPFFAVVSIGPLCPGDSVHQVVAGPGFTFYNSGHNNYEGSEYQYGNAGLSNLLSWGYSNSGSLTCAVASTGIVITAGAITTVQTQTIGSCPKAGNGHVTPSNSTQYWYSGNALGSEVVNTVQTEVSSVKGSSAQNIQLVLYVSTAQSPSVQSPATLAWYQIVSVSAGTTNSTITFQVNIPLNTIASGTLPFNFWAVGIVGNDHVYIVQSTLSGMTTQSGNAAGSVQPYSFTSAGSASGSKMGLCATGNYQSVLPAVTTTVTTGGTTSTTVSTTTTATISTIGPALFSTASNWPVIFLILLLPAGLFLGATRSLAGALLGLAVGSVIGLMMGIIPTFVFAGLLIALVAVAFVARERSP